jgi:hypothetical protein
MGANKKFSFNFCRQKAANILKQAPHTQKILVNFKVFKYYPSFIGSMIDQNENFKNHVWLITSRQ